MIEWDQVPGEVITVISDLHSNKRAIKAALKAVKKKRTDKLIILGDILTYGIDAPETMEMVQGALDDGAQLLTGNHDEIYLDLIAGRDGIFPKLRSDLRESIAYNMNRINEKQFAGWNWKKEIVINNIYFSHANPYGNCWEYVKDKDDYQMAALKLRNMKHLAGVFGHTHRAAHYGLLSGFLPSIQGLSDDTFVINPGSIGQPRSDMKQATMLRLSSHNNKIWAEVEPVPYDMKGHVEDLEKSSLSIYTKSILLHFFKE